MVKLPNDDQHNANQHKASTLVADEAALAHRGLRTQFERIHQALDQGDVRLGARLLNDLIAQVREHFTNEESIALAAGLTASEGGRYLHDTFVERASNLMARCIKAPANSNGKDTIEDELVLLLSDLVENDLRLERSINKAIEKKSSRP